ncbi:MAG: serine hydrolase domain-containing protein, partial [Bacteroidota bacterium]
MKYLLLFSLLVPFPVRSQAEPIAAILDDHLTKGGKNPVRSILLYIDQLDGDAFYQAGHGITQKKNGKPVAKDAQFRIASITKTFVATVVLQLAEEGKLQLSDPIVEHLDKLDFLDIDNLHFHENVPYTST